MKTFECPVCHEQVPVAYFAKKAHMKKHETSTPEVVPNDTVTETLSAPEQSVQQPVVAQEPVASAKPSKEVKWADPTERAIYERAKAVEAKMLEAPETMVVSPQRDEFMELRRFYAPETIDEFENKGGGKVKCTKRATRHEYFAANDNEMKAIAHRGYVPVRDPETGLIVRAKTGEILTTVDRRIFEVQEKSAQAESAARLPGVARKGMPGVMIRDKDDNAAAMSDVDVLEVERKRGSLEDLQEREA